MDNCIFCKIITGKIPSTKIFESEDVYAFEDINKAAPTHFLVVPKKHIATVNDLAVTDAALVGKLYLAAKEVAQHKGVASDGYRLVMNVGEGAGQTVFHIHLHCIAGRTLSWPPG